MNKKGFTPPPVQSKIASLLRFTSQQRRLGTATAQRLCLTQTRPRKRTPSVGLLSQSQFWLSSSFAFTLAEILITLAIVGIVVAITIPSVVRNYQETQRKSAVKKAYSTLARVTSLVMQENGGDMITTPPTENLDGISAYYMDMYKKYIPHTKECRSFANCEAQKLWHKNSDWFLPNGQSAAEQTGGYGYYAAILGNDATMYRFYFYNVTCNYQGTSICGLIIFDTNGFKKPNTICKDIFGITVQKDGKFGNFWSCTFKYLNQ